MRKGLIVGVCFILASCLSESDIDPGDASTFIRYFNGGNNDEAKGLVLDADGGFVILATTRVQKTEANIPRIKIKLIKTDKDGNPIWTALFPDFTVTDRDFYASSIQVLPTGGYVITGDDIQSGGASKVLVMTVDENGAFVKSVSLSSAPGNAENGKAVAVDAAGNFLVLSTLGTQTMYLTEVNKDTFTPSAPIQHTGGSTKLASRLLVDNSGKAVWSGGVTVSGLDGIRLLKTIPNSPTVDFDLLISDPGFSILGFDFCKYGLGYAVAGSTNKKPGGTAPATDTDILFVLTSSEGNITQTNSFPFDNPDTPENEDSQIDAGSSISTTIDGGLIMLSSVNSAAIEGRGDSDFYLIKIDAFGNKEWTSSFGSKFKDEGVSVFQISDGSYVALGTTTQGALKILTLFKTNKNGKID